MTRSIIKILIAILILPGCNKYNGNYNCDYTDSYYYQGELNFVGEMSGDFVLVASDTSNSDCAISKAIKASNYFDQDFNFNILKNDNYKYKQVVLKFEKSLNCNEITNIIAKFKKNIVVEYVHFTIKTDYCNDFYGYPLGEKCVYSYSELFNIKVKDPNNLEDLYNILERTRTELLEQDKFMDAWFTLRAHKNSQGDAMQMASYFYETGLFEASEPDIMTFVVE
jgi:hypothetical protein